MAAVLSKTHPLQTLLQPPLTFIDLFIGYLTPYRQLMQLRKTDDFAGFDAFRDGMMRRWSSGNLMCALIMTAISTVIFSPLHLPKAPYALGITSLLSSLIAIGVGVGLIYVLGDVKGYRLLEVCKRYPLLFSFLLSVPQIWGSISFTTFFIGACFLGWEYSNSNKAWIVKAAVLSACILLILNILAFGFLFRLKDQSEHHDLLGRGGPNKLEGLTIDFMLSHDPPPEQEGSSFSGSASPLPPPQKQGDSSGSVRPSASASSQGTSEHGVPRRRTATVPQQDECSITSHHMEASNVTVVEPMIVGE